MLCYGFAMFWYALLCFVMFCLLCYVLLRFAIFAMFLQCFAMVCYVLLFFGMFCWVLLVMRGISGVDFGRIFGGLGPLGRAVGMDLVEKAWGSDNSKRRIIAI